ncbi:hypothetical protein SAMN05421638_1061 [Kaistella treverensis]|uniref:Uncharacterized protein n=1 Tax=Kaistella treverensis TaxID=631455 RepID=A0A1I3KWJ7_9FLAO|nr:hypothetical protein SAMN05421638_1061 [Kaistella treverensis]
MWELVPINYKAAKIIIFLNATSSHADYLPLKIPSFSGAGNLLSLLASRARFSRALGRAQTRRSTRARDLRSFHFPFPNPDFKMKKFTLKTTFFSILPKQSQTPKRKKMPKKQLFFQLHQKAVLNSKTKKFAVQTANFLISKALNVHTSSLLEKHHNNRHHKTDSGVNHSAAKCL